VKTTVLGELAKSAYQRLKKARAALRALYHNELAQKTGVVVAIVAGGALFVPYAMDQLKWMTPENLAAYQAYQRGELQIEQSQNGDGSSTQAK
jgi:hypothetical protein